MDELRELEGHCTEHLPEDKEEGIAGERKQEGGRWEVRGEAVGVQITAAVLHRRAV